MYLEKYKKIICCFLQTFIFLLIKKQAIVNPLFFLLANKKMYAAANKKKVHRSVPFFYCKL